MSIYINVKPLMDKNGINRYQMSKKLDVTYNTMTKIYNGSTGSIRLDILDGLCKELHCSPSDILISDENKIDLVTKADGTE